MPHHPTSRDHRADKPPELLFVSIGDSYVEAEAAVDLVGIPLLADVRHGVGHGFTMGLPWVYYGFTVGLLWVYHGFNGFTMGLMGLLWVNHGFNMGLMGLLWVNHGFNMGLTWVYYGFHDGLSAWHFYYGFDMMV